VDKKAVWQEMISRLDSISWMENVYDGFVDPTTIPDDSMPCAMLEPYTTEVKEDHYDNTGGNYALEELNLTLWVFFVLWEKEKQVTGTQSLQGIFEREKDIKDKLTEAPIHLDGKVNKISFGRCTYLQAVGEQLKQEVRVIQIEISLLISYST